jgi:large subunit ribosomal protein L16
MLFVPKKSKFKKSQKGKFFNKIRGSLAGVYQLKTGSVGLKSLSVNRITSKQLETLKQTITKTVKKSGKVIINAFPNTQVSKKPIEVRMGKGKGNVDFWVFKVKPGFILCEIVTDNIEIASTALKIVQKKLNLKSKIVFE